MKNIEIRHRYTNAVLFVAQIADDDPFPIRTALVRAVGTGAYLRGADLGGAYLGGAYLRGADLGGADLGGADLGGAYLGDADLGGADLGGAYLGGAYFRGAYLRGADLRGADLGDAKNVPVGIVAPPADPNAPPREPWRRLTDAERLERQVKRAAEYRERHPDVPVIEQLDAKILAAISQTGNALDMATWHSCETTHCRAGWAIHLAGEAGYALEKRTDSHVAGRMIYLASTGRVPHFFASNERALEDIRACAAEQSK